MFVTDPVEIAAFNRQLEEGRRIAIAQEEERLRQDAEKAAKAKKDKSVN